MATERVQPDDVEFLFQLMFSKYRVSKIDIVGQSRKKEFVKCRRLITALLLDEFGEIVVQNEISDILNKDHSSIVHYKKTHFRDYSIYEKYRPEYDDLKRSFKKSIADKKEQIESIKFENLTCDLSQAKKLKDLGFIQNSCLYWFSNNEHQMDISAHKKIVERSEFYVGWISTGTKFNKYAAFAAEELISLIDEKVIISKSYDKVISASIMSDGALKEGTGETISIALANLIINNFKNISLLGLIKKEILVKIL